MAINSDNEVNLIDIITTENGITKLPKNYKINGSFYFLDYKNVYDKNTLSDFKYNKLPKINIFEKDIKKFYKSRKGSIVATWSSETNYDVFQSIYIDTSKPFIVNGFCKIINVIDINLINPKWLTFYLNFNPIIQKQRSSIPYTTRCNMTLNELKNIKIKSIPIESQQQIINIIEPFERLKIYISNFIDKIEILFLKIGEASKILGKMKDFNIKFEKGMNINSKFISNQKSNILFINVSAINNKFNKWLIKNDIKENVEYGDIILSLDGTIGIVNNFLKGFNGYGYKISSTNIDNSIIYCSLIDRRNKQIMIENSTGSVIKHSLNSKNELVLLDIKKEEINKLFKLQITYKKWLISLNKIIKKLIEIYIY